ncbi:jg9481 [Pararge aegeria aegeria]|uniref:Jg9481 protein n=1 Tax=Pararge aegeria aegeria TaxID=348720 RepID=A0A8S4RLI5_9NEOP|nr:jg9481 [Pararge aegeria aegeria]
MELVILKARAQLNRLVSERRASAGKEREARAGGGGGARAAGRERGMAPARPAPATAAPWLNATLAYNLSLSRINSTLDTDYELLNGNSSDDHDNHWFCAKWTSAQQDLFQVPISLLPLAVTRHFVRVYFEFLKIPQEFSIVKMYLMQILSG